MKSIINKEEEKKEEILVFPCLKESVTGNIFYCITNEQSVCLVAKGGNFKVGQLCSPMASKMNDFKGSITLSNE